MLHHLSLGVRDLDVAGRFYDAVLAALGYRRVFEDETAIGYGLVDDEDALCLKLRDDAVAPGPGSIWRSLPMLQRPSMPSMQRPWPTVEVTMVLQACAPITAKPTTQPLWSIPTAIAWKR